MNETWFHFKQMPCPTFGSFTASLSVVAYKIFSGQLDTKMGEVCDVFRKFELQLSSVAEETHLLPRNRVECCDLSFCKKNFFLGLLIHRKYNIET